MSIRNRALRGDDARAAILLMAAVVLPLPQGAMMRLKASQWKVDVSITFYKYLPDFILRIYPPIYNIGEVLPHPLIILYYKICHIPNLM